MSSLMPSTLILSCPIDFPYGLSETKVRQHETLSAIKRGATAIDLILNPVYLLNDKAEKLIKDIRANKAICSDNDVIFRVMLDYHSFTQEIYSQMIFICKNLRLPYIFPSTGHFSDDYMDNLIVSKLIQAQYPSAKVITNGNIWKKEHYDTVSKSGLHGVRLRSNYDIRVLQSL